MIYVTRKEHFNAAHKLYNPNWSQEKNQEVFGACANENWHGHNFKLEVTVKGKVDPETGFVVDLKQLGDLIKREVVDKVDHKNLDLDVPFLKGQLNSCENVIIKFWEILAPLVKDMTYDGGLHKLELIETPKNSVAYYGE
ncbi:MAG: 6-carboxytetrahydropterin synthase [Cyclobacteriaceae bacterium]